MTKGNTRIIQSIWTAPLSHRWNVKEQLKKTLWSYAWSVITLRKTFREVVLHTDKQGAEIFGKLPYTEIHTTLENLKGINKRWWSYGKIKALEAENINTVHVDGDVYLKNPDADIFSFDNADLIVQMIEAGEGFYSVYPPLYEIFKSCLDAGGIKFVPKYNEAYNCGILGFSDKNARKTFLDTYTNWLKVVNNSEIINVPPMPDPNVVIEQYCLYTLAKDNGWKVKELIPTHARYTNLNAYAVKIGFRHAWGKIKYTEEFQNLLKSRIKNHSASLYKKIKSF